MKKLLFAFLLSAISHVFTNAQLTTEDSINITRTRWRDSTFRMNMQYVPTGILPEYSMFPFETAKYDGLNNNDDTLKFDGHFYMLHNILTGSIVNATANLLPTDTLFAKAFWHNRNTGKIPFTLILQPYNRIRQSSLSEGLFTIAGDSVGILDVLPRPVTPYDSFYAFFAAPFITTITQFNAVPFSFPDTLWQIPGINSISVNFDNGAGFQTIAKNAVVNIYYATEGLKLITIQINTSGGTRTAKCQINYKRPVSWSPPSAEWNFEVDPVYTSDEQYLGQARIQEGSLFDCGGTFLQQLLCNAKAGARVEVENGCDNVFDKPVIIVEGFDPDGSLNIEELRERFNVSYPFIQTLKVYGYDIVYVDFTKNGDYIENNAKVLEAVINKVNEEKVGNLGNNIIGFSMGGLITRWCLRDMEDRSIDHEVDNYFSYDAPHQGANIPLGMQYLFKEIEYDLPYLRWFNAGGFRDISKANNSPAARQMLVTKPIYTGINLVPSSQTLTDLRAAFAQRLVAKGYPQQTINYGISFGRGNNTTSTKNAGNGVQWDNFGPGTQIFKGNMTWFLANFQSKGYAVQENNVNDFIAKYRFEGLTFRTIFGLPIFPAIVLRIRNFKYISQFPYDEAPGGYELTQGQFAASLVNWANGAATDATTFNHNGHNFVSVASALDLQNQTYGQANNWQSSNMFFNIDNSIQNPGAVSGNTLSNPALSPFTAVITSTSNSFGVNLFHNADISNANALFILRKILNVNPNFNCLSDGFCGANPSIIGDTRFCTTANYQLINFPAGISILWSSVSGKFNITNGQGTPNITVSKISGGTDILRVVITNACGTSLTFEKNVTVDDGIPSVSGTYTFNGQNLPLQIWNGGNNDYNNVCNLQLTNTNMNIQGAATVTWSRISNIPNHPAPWSQNGNDLSFYLTSVNQKTIFRVTASNSCGTVLTDFGFKSIDCGDPCNSFQVSPNPARGLVFARKIPQVPPPCFGAKHGSNKEKTFSELAISEIRIYDNTGNLKKVQKENRSSQATVNISGFKAGIYILEISDGDYKERHRIIVQE